MINKIIDFLQLLMKKAYKDQYVNSNKIIMIRKQQYDYNVENDFKKVFII